MIMLNWKLIELAYHNKFKITPKGVWGKLSGFDFFINESWFHPNVTFLLNEPIVMKDSLEKLVKELKGELSLKKNNTRISCRFVGEFDQQFLIKTGKVAEALKQDGIQSSNVEIQKNIDVSKEDFELLNRYKIFTSLKTFVFYPAVLFLMSPWFKGLPDVRNYSYTQLAASSFVASLLFTFLILVTRKNVFLRPVFSLPEPKTTLIEWHVLKYGWIYVCFVFLLYACLYFMF
jgi:hypothetical protein